MIGLPRQTHPPAPMWTRLCWLSDRTLLSFFRSLLSFPLHFPFSHDTKVKRSNNIRFFFLTFGSPSRYHINWYDKMVYLVPNSHSQDDSEGRRHSNCPRPPAFNDTPPSRRRQPRRRNTVLAGREKSRQMKDDLTRPKPNTAR